MIKINSSSFFDNPIQKSRYKDWVIWANVDFCRVGDPLLKKGNFLKLMMGNIMDSEKNVYNSKFYGR